MTSFPGSPRLLKGAIVGLSKVGPQANAVAFQYNPDTMTRSLKPRTATASDDDSDGPSRKEAFRITGPPEETISLKIELDATDRLEQGDINALQNGIHPQLAALELLLYPKSETVLKNQSLSKTGTLEVVPVELPLALLVWGVKRTVPVRLESLSIEEQAYDTNLNPIRAVIDLSLRVLSYADLEFDSKGGSLFMAHQVQKERLAASAVSKTTLQRVQVGR